MNSQKLSGAVSCLAAILILAADKIFAPVCKGTMELTNGGECIYFDEAYERGMRLLGLELKDLEVNMFAAANNSLINDGCGLYRGRLILPYEHLSRFQTDLND